MLIITGNHIFQCKTIRTFLIVTATHTLTFSLYNECVFYVPAMETGKKY